MSDASAIAYLFSLTNYEVVPFRYGPTFNLKRMALLLDWLGHPERQFDSVVIAGTKGKGSTARFLSSILMAHGSRTGLYTSPHLMDLRERIQINGRMISRSEFGRLAGKVRYAIGKHKKELARYGAVTFFEALTLVAMLYFAAKKVRYGVFEVGMGGRFDAVNILNPRVSVITPISFDHEEHLGRTLARIAGEKAAIIKPNGIVVVGNQSRSARHVIEREVRRKKAKFFIAGRDFKVTNVKLDLKETSFDVILKPEGLKDLGTEIRLRRLLRRLRPNGLRMTKMRNVKIRLPGRFQVVNAATALATALVLKRLPPHPSLSPLQGEREELKESRVRGALKRTFWPGRFEVINKKGRTYLLDGAHNGASMEALFDSVKAYFGARPQVVILGTSREKQLEPMLKPMLSQASFLIATRSRNPRAQEPRIILEAAERAGFTRPSFWAEDIGEALKLAETLRGTAIPVIVVTGSLFLVGEARKVLKCPIST